MKKEFFILVILFLLLSAIVHFKEFSSYPLEHLQNLPNSGAYGLGFSHPFIFTIILYIFLMIPRLLIVIYKKIFIKKF